MTMDLSFLKNVEIKEVAIKAKAERIKLNKEPVPGASFRVYKNGRIFTADSVATEHELEFTPKKEIVIPGKKNDENDTKDIVTGNGLDIFSSENWQMIATPEPMLFVAVVPRNDNPKIDVYGSTSYEEDGTPKRSIHSNTVSSFGKDVLVPLLESLYGINFEEVDFIDLIMNTEYSVKAPRGVFSIPKTVSRGKNKGDLVFLTRKNITVFPLTVFEGVPEPENVAIDTKSSGAEDNQVNLEDSIKEMEIKSKIEVIAPKIKKKETEFESPNVNNDFKKNQIKS